MKNVLHHFSTRLVLLMHGIFLVSLAACGGGGGGGGGSADSPTGVRVLHAAIDGAPVDVLSTTPAQTLVSKAYFASDKGYQALPSGALTLQLTRAQTPSAIVETFPVTATSESRFSILFYGDNSVFGLRTKLLTDVIPEGDGVYLRIVDGATGAATVRSTVVVRSPGEQRETVTTSFGEASDYIALPAGNVTVRAVREADASILATAQFDAAAGGAYTVLIAGEAQYYTKAVVFRDR